MDVGAALDSHEHFLLGGELNEATAAGFKLPGFVGVVLGQDFRADDVPKGTEEEGEVLRGKGEGHVSDEDLMPSEGLRLVPHLLRNLLAWFRVGRQEGNEAAFVGFPTLDCSESHGNWSIIG